MDEIQLDLTELNELYRCYMPFLKNGGLFVPTAQPRAIGEIVSLAVRLPGLPQPVRLTGKVAWLTPQGTQSSTPAGMGVAFPDEYTELRQSIETLLGDKLDSNEPTYSL